MSLRYRWYRMKFPKTDLDLRKLLLSKPLLTEGDSGFVYVDDNFGEKKFRFLWRTKVVVTGFDEDGETIYNQVASLSFTDFALVTVDRTTYLRIENPGRNVRSLLNELESIIGLGFMCEPLTFENTKPTTIFEDVEATKLVGLKVVGAVVHEDVVARMEFASKQGMIIENLKLLNDMQYKVDFVAFELFYQGVKGQVAFASNGLVKVSGQLAPKLLKLIEKDLPSLH